MDWYPWNIKAWRADTAHLTTLEKGAYRELIDHYMDTRLPLPDDDRALAKIAGLTGRQWSAMSTTIRAFFTPENGRLHLKHCDAELDAQDGGASKRSKHARKAASDRWRKVNGKMPGASNGHQGAVPEHTATMPADATGEDRTEEEKKITTTEIHPETDAHRADARLSPELVAEFEATFWPNCWVKSGKKPALKAFIKARKRASLEVIMAGVFRYKQILDGPDPPKPKWPQGWLNDDRWTDQALQLRQPPAARHGQAGL